MRRRATWFGGVLLVSLAVAWADDVPLADVPKAVMDAVKTRFKEAMVVGASKELDDDKKLVYEMNLKLKGQTIDVIVTPEGDIVLFEKSLDFKDLPEAVAKALKEKYAGATYKLVEEVHKVKKGKENLAFYEAHLVTSAKKQLEVKVTAEGKIFSEKEAEAD